MVRIDLKARRICRLDVVDAVAFPDDDSDFGRDTDIKGGSEAGAAAGAAMSDIPLMCCRKLCHSVN